MPIAFRKLSHTYNEGTPFAYAALKDIDLNIPEGQITAIIGETGSGKSTLVQHLNALLLPTQGELEVCGKVIRAAQKPKNLKELRKNVGLVFQFPEYQLFEETIEKDIAFGPKNFGVDEEEAGKTVRKVLPLVGLGDISAAHRLNCLADRNAASPLPASWRWILACSCLMSRRPDWIRRVQKR